MNVAFFAVAGIIGLSFLLKMLKALEVQVDSETQPKQESSDTTNATPQSADKVAQLLLAEMGKTPKTKSAGIYVFRVWMLICGWHFMSA